MPIHGCAGGRVTVFRSFEREGLQMTSAFPVPRLLAMAALTLATLLASCAPPPPPPLVVQAPIPAVSLSSRVVELASAYRAYLDHASTISPAFNDGSAVADGVRIGASYEPQQLLRGAIAYGAVAALQDPEFVAGVRKFVADPDQRRTVAYQIMKDPAYAAGFAGSASAAGLVKRALGEDGRKLLEQGKQVKQAAYDVQHSAWSKADVIGRDSRLAQAKQLSTTPLRGDVAETSRLQMAVNGAAPMGLAAEPAGPPYTPVVVHSLAVAALAALGYADDASLGQVMPILSDPGSASCLNMSKLNLYQCLAVAKPHYEDVFCLGQHILMDTGQCLMKSSGLRVATDTPPSPPAATAVPVSTSKAKSRAKKH